MTREVAYIVFHSSVCTLRERRQSMIERSVRQYKGCGLYFSAFLNKNCSLTDRDVEREQENHS